MHYRNGREAKEGDQVILKDQYTGKIKVGTIHSLQSACTSCNGQLCRVVPGGTTNDCVTVGECLHAEDAWNAVDRTVDAEVTSASIPGYVETPKPTSPTVRKPTSPTVRKPTSPTVSTLCGCQLK